MTHRDEIINYIFNKMLEKKNLISDTMADTISDNILSKDAILVYMCFNKDNYNSLNNYYNSIQIMLDEYIKNDYLFHTNEY
jgi:hypothetical protein